MWMLCKRGKYSSFCRKKLKRSITILFGVLFLSGCKDQGNQGYQEWSVYRGNNAAEQFSSLDQIDTKNVHLLEPAWVFHTGDTGRKSTIECNPLMVDSTLYVVSPFLHLIALDPATGKQKWRLKPYGEELVGGVSRGLTYFKHPAFPNGCVFFSAGHFLFAVDAKTGILLKQFGQEGKIDLNENLVRDPKKLSVALSSPPLIVNNTLIIGSATGEGYQAAPGHIRAYDAVTGALKWVFRTIPEKGEEGYESWEWQEGVLYGGANNWGGMSAHEVDGVVYVSTGSATYDFYGANRPGKNLFANCIIALDVQTGSKIWHHQTIAHDLWDYDLPCAPTIATIPWKGQNLDVVIQPTKFGEIIVLDRKTGKLLKETDSLAVPPSSMPGEKIYPVQELGQGYSLVSNRFDTNALTNISPEANAYVRNLVRGYDYRGPFTPPSLEGTIVKPGPRGGILWGGISYDAQNAILYANANEFPMVLAMGEVGGAEEGGSKGLNAEAAAGRKLYLSSCANCHGAQRQGIGSAFPALVGIEKKLTDDRILSIIKNGKGLMPPHAQYTAQEQKSILAFLKSKEQVENAVAEPKEKKVKETVRKSDKKQSATAFGKRQREEEGELKGNERERRFVMKGFKLLTDEEGYPGSLPPWGTLNAMDLRTGKILWKVPLGFYPELKKRGIPETGTMNYGGAVATAGGLVFVGATADECFRAYDAKTGKELWRFQLPAGAYAVPAVYMINGKQYVVIAAGGGNRMGTPSGDSFYAFALPDQQK